MTSFRVLVCLIVLSRVFPDGVWLDSTLVNPKVSSFTIQVSEIIMTYVTHDVIRSTNCPSFLCKIGSIPLSLYLKYTPEFLNPSPNPDHKCTNRCANYKTTKSVRFVQIGTDPCKFPDRTQVQTPFVPGLYLVSFVRQRLSPFSFVSLVVIKLHINVYNGRVLCCVKFLFVNKEFLLKCHESLYGRGTFRTRFIFLFYL